LLRDVMERHNLSQPQILRWLVQQLLGNAAGAFSIHKFFSDLRSCDTAVGKDTLHQMLAHLEDAFLLSTVGLATDSARRRQVNPRKVYPVDTGLALGGGRVTDHRPRTALKAAPPTSCPGRSRAWRRVRWLRWHRRSGGR
jgi:hypothetical protein